MNIVTKGCSPFMNKNDRKSFELDTKKATLNHVNFKSYKSSQIWSEILFYLNQINRKKLFVANNWEIKLSFSKEKKKQNKQTQRFHQYGKSLVLITLGTVFKL